MQVKFLNQNCQICNSNIHFFSTKIPMSIILTSFGDIFLVTVHKKNKNSSHFNRKSILKNATQKLKELCVCASKLAKITHSCLVDRSSKCELPSLFQGEKVIFNFPPNAFETKTSKIEANYVCGNLCKCTK